jgi:hypothetical protein
MKGCVKELVPVNAISPAFSWTRERDWGLRQTGGRQTLVEERMGMATSRDSFEADCTIK